MPHAWRLIAILFLAGHPMQAQAQALGEPIARRVDALFASYDREGSPGYAVGIVRNGELVFARGYGHADLDHGVPITPRTAFHVASSST